MGWVQCVGCTHEKHFSSSLSLPKSLSCSGILLFLHLLGWMIEDIVEIQQSITLNKGMFQYCVAEPQTESSFSVEIWDCCWLQCLWFWFSSMIISLVFSAKGGVSPHHHTASVKSCLSLTKTIWKGFNKNKLKTTFCCSTHYPLRMWHH